MNATRSAASPGPLGIRPTVWMIFGCLWFAVMILFTHDLGLPEGPGGPPRCAWPVVAFVRSVVATVCGFALTRASGAALAVTGPRVLWLRSVAGSTSMMATFYALAYLPGSDVLTLANTCPIWVALLAWPLARERPSAGVWFAVAMSVAGVAVALQPGGAGFLWLPAAAALVGAFFTAVAMLGLNRLKSVHPFAVVTHFSAVSAAFGLASWMASELGVLPVGADGDPTWYRHPLVWAEILGVGATATAGQVCLTLAYSRGVATRIAVVGLSQVVLVLAGEAVLGWKELTPVMLVGTAMVLGPTAWLMLRERRGPRSARPAPIVATPVAAAVRAG